MGSDLCGRVKGAGRADELMTSGEHGLSSRASHLAHDGALVVIEGGPVHARPTLALPRNIVRKSCNGRRQDALQRILRHGDQGWCLSEGQS